MKKRIFSFVLALVMIFTIMPAGIFDLTASAATTASGTCGENLTWVLDSDGVLTISGTGEMDELLFYGAPWTDYNDSILSVDIKEGVTNIGNYAFISCVNLESVRLPDGIEEIGDYAFTFCNSLKSINIPASVTSIGIMAFAHCMKLTDIIIPQGVKSIGDNAFYYCEGLKSISISDGLETIGEGAFSHCANLTDINIPASVKSIGSEAFIYCQSLKDIQIDSDNNYYSVQDGVLFNKSKTELICYLIGKTEKNYTVPNSVKTIHPNAFTFCRNLISLTIPNSVTSIGGYAFSFCENLYAVNIPNSIKVIPEGTFMYCKGLADVTIPNSVTSIGDYALAFCEGLRNITIPDSVTEIGVGAFSCDYYINSIILSKNLTEISSMTFSSCGRLKNITIPDGVKTIGSNAFSGCYSLTGVSIPDTVTNIEFGAFYKCEALSDIEIPQGVTIIQSGTFGYCKKLNNVIIPDGVTKIEDDVFYDCEGLEKITIPGSVTHIGDNTFVGCTKLEEIFYSGTEKSWNRITTGKNNNRLFSAKLSYICFKRHEWKDATCVSPKTCDICGYTEGEIGTKHSFSEYVYNNDGNYREDGTKTRICLGCNEKETVTAEGTKVDKVLINSSEVFKDISSDAWYKDYVDFAVTYGIFKGTASDIFSPETDMTRAQMVQVFANLSGIDTSDTNVESGFIDVPKGTWYASAVTWAAQNDIVNGIGGGMFDPDAKITREQMCLMLCNYIEKYLGKTIEPEKEVSVFADDGSISDWAKDAVYKCAKSGLVNGVGNNKFDPQSTATRAQGATLFTNFYKKYM